MPTSLPDEQGLFVKTDEKWTRRLLDHTPDAFRGGENLQRFLQPLGEELARMERATVGLMRSRWYGLAQGWDDPGASSEEASATELGRLAALYGLRPGVGEATEHFRRHLHDFVAVHRAGLTTPSAILQLVALAFGAEGPPDLSWDGEVAVGYIQVRATDGKPRTLRVEVVDGPLSPAAATFEEVEPGQELVLSNAGLDPAFPEISLTATRDDVAIPVLTQVETGVRVLFVGYVPQASVLTLRHEQPPVLDGYLADRPAVVPDAYRFDSAEARFGPNEAARFTSQEVLPRLPPLPPNRDQPVFVLEGHRFDGQDFKAPYNRFYLPESPETSARFANFEPKRSLPPLPQGESRWTYDTLTRTELDTYLAYAAYQPSLRDWALPHRHAPPVKVEFRWQEATPATFEVRIPRDAVALAGLLEEALEYGRAAGIKARLRCYERVDSST